MLLSKLLLLELLCVAFLRDSVLCSPYDVVMGLVYQDDNADVYLVVDDVVYSCCGVDVLVDVHSDAVVCDDQNDVDDVLVLILDAVLIADVVVVVVDVHVLYVVADHDTLCVSMLDGLRSRANLRNDLRESGLLRC